MFILKSKHTNVSLSKSHRNTNKINNTITRIMCQNKGEIYDNKLLYTKIEIKRTY